ncbi:MAG: S8 family serine peptidase, partial [Actinomycetota bacterium]|nr:S8 family serine peptidase [Actinomycetota bacterium]
FHARHNFSHALKGFSAALNPGQVRSLRANPKVALVAPDREVEATGSVPLSTGDSAPPGVRRIEAATTSSTHEASSANVAVIDTGIDLAHPDLNAAHGVNCISSGAAQDDNGHGTHVAGTIAAENNGAGVVGVAPGTKLYAAKVLDATGSGTMSGVICGIDWVTSTRTDADTSNDIAVANMSLGGAGPSIETCATTTDPEHLAICRSTAAGVTYVVAAGNDGWDFDYAPNPDLPAAYPEVLTVSAMSDGDGTSGGLVRPACDSKSVDDSYALYSNFAATSAGAEHTIAGPGTCITSTVPGGGYGTMSGTSMATPHVSGAVALCFGENGGAGPCTGLTPSQIVAHMRAEAAARPSTYGFTGDPTHPVSGRYYGYLSWVGITETAPPPPADTTAPAVTSVSPGDGATGVDSATWVNVAFSEEMDKASAESAFSLVRSSDGVTVPGTFSWSGATMRFVPSTPLAQGTTYSATVATSATDLAANQLAAPKTWSFKTITHVVAAPGSTSILSGSLRSGTAARLAADDAVYYEVSSSTKSPYVASWYGSFTGVADSLSNLRITYKGKLSRKCTQVLSLYRWSTTSWVEVDSRTVSNTPVLIDKAVTGAPGDYVSGTSGDGELRMRVRCKANGSFFSSGDLMRISYGKP